MTLKLAKRGVSVITCTNDPRFKDNLFLNFQHQKWSPKELIIILNSDAMNLSQWQNEVQHYPQVSVYQLPEQTSLGNCLNFAIQQAKFNYVAKFDHDDYYAPNYLAEAMGAFQRTKADIVGKRSYFLYFLQTKGLRVRFPSREKRWVRQVHGSTLVMKKQVAQAIPFVDVPLGEEIHFFKACRQQGVRIFSTSRFNYTYLRRGDATHAWKADLKYLLRTSKPVARIKNFRRYAQLNWNSN